MGQAGESHAANRVAFLVDPEHRHPALGIGEADDIERVAVEAVIGGTLCLEAGIGRVADDPKAEIGGPQLVGLGQATRAGLLATDGTVQSGIYESCFAGSGIELITPSPEAQAAVMDLTYNGVKAGRRDFDTSGFEKAVRELFDNGAQTLILGCTELPPAFDMYGLDYKHIDPSLVLARAAVLAAGGKLREA